MSGILGIIAGGGFLPLVIAREASAGQGVFIVRLSGYADEALETFDGVTLNIGEIGRTIAALTSAGCQTIVFAGAVKRPDFADLELDVGGRSYLPRLFKAAQSGDDALLATLVEIFGESGFNVTGAHEVCADLLCPAGPIVAGLEPTAQAKADLKKAYRIARMIGREDIGQGCVVANGLVLAMEAQEGTDGMLRRIVSLPEAVRGTVKQPRGVLVKCAKPGQDRRIDLPVIGIQTVQEAYEAGLVGIGLEAGSCLIVARDEVAELARTLGVFVVGLEHEPDTAGE